jgi:1-aminocyclopropane-1-carboxylate deaminase
MLSPVIEIVDSRLNEVRLWLKRDDLIHPEISGNKWRKLKYNIIHAKNQHLNLLITKGGAFSNHIYATAAAGREFGFQTIGIIRGESVSNPTLEFAAKCGMKLIFIDRSTFREINAYYPFSALGIEETNYLFLPEGGTNELAIQGAAEMVDESIDQLGFLADYYCLSAGTGGTAAGLIKGLKGKSKVLAFSALKGEFLVEEIQNHLEQTYDNWTLETQYHFGGYAKFDLSLIEFINHFKQLHNIPLDPVYTGKLMYGLFDKIQKGHFAPGTRILAIHSGGLQGNNGFNFRYGNLLN